MSGTAVENVLGGLVALGLLVHLLVALVHPERSS